MPSNQDSTSSQLNKAGPRVIDLTAEEADNVFSALSGEPARVILDRLYDEPKTKSELADELDTSIQHVDYHLQKLDDADLVVVVDTVHSEKQREMKVYGPADNSLAIIGTESPIGYLKERLGSIFGVVLLLGVSAAALFFLIEQWVEEEFVPVEQGDWVPIGADPDDTMILQVEQMLLNDPIVAFVMGGLVVLFGFLVVDYIRRVRS